MTTIPYGYRIERGKAVIEEEEAQLIREAFSLYLDGYSGKKILEETQIPRSIWSIRKMLRSSLYTGDDYYPAIVDQATFDAVQVEADRRFAHMNQEVRKWQKNAIPVKRRFVLQEPPEVKNTQTSVEKLEFLYSLICPSDDGDTTISPADRAILNKYARE